METHDLTKLIVKAQAGQSEAFGQIYDYFSRPLFRFIRAKVQGKEQAEDLLQETFIKAWRGLPLYRPQGGSFSGWLYRIAINSVTDYYRKAGRSVQTVEIVENLDLPTQENQEQNFDKVFDIKFLRGLLHQLPEKHRTVLELRFISDLTIQETAAALGRSELAVRVLQHRALKRLKVLIKRQPKHDSF